MSFHSLLQEFGPITGNFVPDPVPVPEPDPVPVPEPEPFPVPEPEPVPAPPSGVPDEGDQEPTTEEHRSYMREMLYQAAQRMHQKGWPGQPARPEYRPEHDPEFWRPLRGPAYDDPDPEDIWTASSSTFHEPTDEEQSPRDAAEHPRKLYDPDLDDDRSLHDPEIDDFGEPEVNEEEEVPTDIVDDTPFVEPQAKRVRTEPPVPPPSPGLASEAGSTETGTTSAANKIPRGFVPKPKIIPAGTVAEPTVSRRVLPKNHSYPSSTSSLQISSST